METLRVLHNCFDHHPPKKLVTGSVNTEKIKFILDASWDGLTIFASFLNTQEGQERSILLDETLECVIPWECCTLAGSLNIGILGRDGDQIVKPTLWHLFGYVLDGTSPDGGITTQAHTPDVLAQMMELLRQASDKVQAVANAIEVTTEAAQIATVSAQQAETAAQNAANQAAAGAEVYTHQAYEFQQAAQQSALQAMEHQENAQQAVLACTTAQQLSEHAAALAHERAEQTNDLELAIRLGLNYARQNAWLVEQGQIQLTNSANYLFNNSAKTVALSKIQDVPNYVVLTEAVLFSGLIGSIVVTDKLTNGFKLGYTGSAKSVTIKYVVIGGLMK